MITPSGVPDPDLTREGPLDPATAQRMLATADSLAAAAEFPLAIRYYQRLVGATPDPNLTAAALYGLGMAFYRIDQEEAAGSAWQQILTMPENAWTYRAWREIAGMRVRERDLAGARKAYLEAQKRAPVEDRPEIASRLGWLAKEMGDTGTASRYFSRSRGDTAPPYVTYAIIGITVVISLIAFQQGENGWLYRNLELDKAAVARGEYWRLWTVTLLHGNYLHLFFNMYALYLAGLLVEQLYGGPMTLVIYLLAAAAGSVGSFLFGGDVPSVGASGAIFGLFGLLVAVSRTHKPMLDRRGQMLLGQMAGLVVINLLFGFMVPGIDIWAHIGGLLAGLWLGVVLPPTRVPTMASYWQTSGGGALVSRPLAGIVRVLAVLALCVVIAAGLAYGTSAREGRPGRSRSSGEVGPPAATVATAVALSAAAADATRPTVKPRAVAAGERGAPAASAGRAAGPR